MSKLILLLALGRTKKKVSFLANDNSDYTAMTPHCGSIGYGILIVVAQNESYSLIFFIYFISGI